MDQGYIQHNVECGLEWFVGGLTELKLGSMAQPA